eukprot:tig00020910_g15699.t1
MEAFERIKDLVTKAPVLASPDWSPDANPLILTTDASKIGLGVCLSQVDKKTGVERPIAWILENRDVNARFNRWSTIFAGFTIIPKLSANLMVKPESAERKEYIAALTASIQQEIEDLWVDLESTSSPSNSTRVPFRAFDRGFHPLPNSPSMAAAVTQAKEQLAACLKVETACGTGLQDGPYYTKPSVRVDPRERAAQRQAKDEGSQERPKVGAKRPRSPSPSPTAPPPSPPAVANAPKPQAAPPVAPDNRPPRDPLPPPVSVRDIRFAQHADDECRRIINILEGKAEPLDAIAGEAERSRETSFREHVRRFFLLDKDRTLYHETPPNAHRPVAVKRFFVPYSVRDALLRSKHGGRVAPSSPRAVAGPPGIASHQGVGRLLHDLKRAYFWPGMYHDVRKFVGACEICQQAKQAKLVRAPPHAIITNGPCEILYMDEVFLTTGQKGTRDAATILNHGSSGLGQQPIGSQRILSAMDAFSGFLFTSDPKRKAHDHTDVARFLREIFCFCD